MASVIEISVFPPWGNDATWDKIQKQNQKKNLNFVF